MALSKKDLEAMRLLFREEIGMLRDEMSTRFDTVADQLDGLYQRDEKREQEYLVITEQTTRLAERVSEFEKKSA